MLTRAPLVIDGVRDVLDALHQIYVMGIVTSSGHEHFEIIHRLPGRLSCSKQHQRTFGST